MLLHPPAAGVVAEVVSTFCTGWNVPLPLFSDTHTPGRRTRDVRTLVTGQVRGGLRGGVRECADRSLEEGASGVDPSVAHLVVARAVREPAWFAYGTVPTLSAVVSMRRRISVFDRSGRYALISVRSATCGVADDVPLNVIA